ncbi:MAG: sulfotransferase domain-containing protein [Myxococcota bacterium]
MTTNLPSPTREYKNHHLDSTRWRAFQPRDDDIIVTTSYKSGTTWMQQILHLLIFKDTPSALPVGLVSPWIDARFHGPLEEVAAGLEAQTHRRFVKSHLPLDGLPYYPRVKYVVVARDARDVFMSLWNHYGSYTDEIMQRLNERSGWSGESLPDPPAADSIRELWHEWMTRGWFGWESEGWPFWSNLHHTQTYWPYRDLENIRFFHYADMLADLRGQILRLAGYLGFELTDEELERVLESSSFDQMKKDYKATMDEPLRGAFKGGADSFIFKGTNGRWRDVLTAQDLSLYEAAKERVLTPDCAAWLETGWLGSGSSS